MRLRTPSLLLLSSAVWSWSPAVRAQEQKAPDDIKLKLIMARSLQSDSNLLRISSQANPQATLGRSSAADTLQTTTVGFQARTAWSLQEWEAAFTAVEYRFNRFDRLDFQAKNYDAAWHWAFTPRLTGVLSTRRSQTLNSFADIQNVNASNRRDVRESNWDGVYDLGGAWRLTAGVGQNTYRNQQQVLGEDDVQIDTRNAGVRYVFASGSVLSYQYRRSRGEYLHRTLPTPALQDTQFHQQGHRVGLQWNVTGKTAINATIERLERAHPHYPVRDYSGLIAQVGVNWALSAHWLIAASYARDMASYQTATSNYSQTDTLRIGPVWLLGPRTSLRLSHSVAQRDFIGPSGNSTRSDTTRNSALALEWQPETYLTVSPSLQRATRTSTVSGQDYEANVANLAVQLSF